MILITLLSAHGHGSRYGFSCCLVDQGIRISMMYNVCCGPGSVTCEVCNICYLIYELFFIVFVLLWDARNYKMVVQFAKKGKEKLS